MRPGIDLAGKRVLVVGLARTGVVTALFCAGYGATVTATDEHPEAELARNGSEAARGGSEARAWRTHIPKSFANQDLIVVSPGVPANSLRWNWRGRAEFRYGAKLNWPGDFLRGKLIAITGSNGKTTTTSLVAHILKTAAIPTLVGGNIGTPLLARVEYSMDTTVTVAEISSFQLETIERFRPEIGVLLNLTPDHLDRHGSFEEYARAKMRMFENQTRTRHRDPERGRSGDYAAHARQAAHFLVQPAEARGARRVRARWADLFSQRRIGGCARAARRNSAARRAQRRKRSGRLRRGVPRRSRPGGHRGPA